MSEMKPTREGGRLFEEYICAKQALDHATQIKDRAARELQEATEAIARWMLPPDAKPGETIAVWFGDSLLAVTAGSLYGGATWKNATVAIRTRGKSVNEVPIRPQEVVGDGDGYG